MGWYEEYHARMGHHLEKFTDEEVKGKLLGLMEEIRVQSSLGGFGFLESLGGMFADEYRARKGDHPLVREFFRLVRERRGELTREWR